MACRSCQFVVLVNSPLGIMVRKSWNNIGASIMPRPIKALSDWETAIMLHLRSRSPPMGYRLIARRINEDRGAWKKTGKARRDIEVSHELIRQWFQRCQETKPSRNVLELLEGLYRQETTREFDERRTKPQVTSKEGVNGE